MQLTPGYKRTEAGVIPDQWVALRLPEACWFQEGPGVRTHQFRNTGVKLINGTNISSGRINLEKTNRHVSAEEAYGPYKHFLVDDGDVLLATSGVTIDKLHDKVAFARSEHLPLCMNTSTVRFKPHKGKLLDRLLFFFLQSSIFKKQIGGQATGSAQLNFGPSHLARVFLPLPASEGEQRAIAAALSDVDALIGTLDELIAKKRDLKQAAMQQLLTGQTRLPGFSGEWHERLLGEGCELLSGHHILAKFCNSNGEGVPYLTGPADFPAGVIRHSKYTTQPVTMCRRNDILVTVKGSGAGTMVLANASYCISRQLMAIRVQQWDTVFICSLLRRDASQFGAAATGLIPGLSRGDILKKKVVVPSPPEQRAIATVLSDMDAELAALEARRDKTRALKQGMMQELLTGRIRLD